MLNPPPELKGFFDNNLKIMSMVVEANDAILNHDIDTYEKKERLVRKLAEKNRQILKDIIKKHGISPEEVKISGFSSEE